MLPISHHWKSWQALTDISNPRFIRPTTAGGTIRLTTLMNKNAGTNDIRCPEGNWQMDVSQERHSCCWQGGALIKGHNNQQHTGQLSWPQNKDDLSFFKVLYNAPGLLHWNNARSFISGGLMLTGFALSCRRTTSDFTWMKSNLVKNDLRSPFDFSCSRRGDLLEFTGQLGWPQNKDLLVMVEL